MTPAAIAVRRWVRAGIAIAAALVGLAGCRMLDKHAERKIPQYGTMDPSLPRELRKVSMPRHVIEPPDQLRITARPSMPDLSEETVTVQPDGMIELGVYGHYYVTGMTPEEVEQRLTAAIALVPQRKDVKEPLQVAVQVLDGANSKRYYVLGAVSNASSFPIRGNETVLDGILTAGLRSHSLPEKAYLVRPHADGGEDQVFSIDWPGITQRGDTTTNYQLMPGDRIYVPGGKPPGLLQTLMGGR